jgi:hypothetical protein
VNPAPVGLRSPYHTHTHTLTLSLSLSMALQPFVGPWSFLQFRNLSTQILGLLGRVISPSPGRYLHMTTQTQNKRTQTSMPQAGFEPTIPVFERAKMAHALGRTTTVIGRHPITGGHKYKDLIVNVGCWMQD